MFRNEEPYLKEWVEYHLAAGVEHFWLYNNNSDDHSLEVLKPYVEKGIVEVFFWPTTPLESCYVGAQLKAFRDGINRSCKKSTWIALIDIDEFILPMQDHTIIDCLNNHFSKADAIYVNWRNFGTGGIYLTAGQSQLLNLTACSRATHSDNGIGKSIVRPEFVDQKKIGHLHHFPLINDRHYINGDNEKIDRNELDLFPDGHHHDQHIRINHYVLRDENYFHNVRLPRAQEGIRNLNLLLEHYILFSETNDFAIINFMLKNFDAEQLEFWKNIY